MIFWAFLQYKKEKAAEKGENRQLLYLGRKKIKKTSNCLKNPFPASNTPIKPLVTKKVTKKFKIFFHLY